MNHEKQGTTRFHTDGKRLAILRAKNKDAEINASTRAIYLSFFKKSPLHFQRIRLCMNHMVHEKQGTTCFHTDGKRLAILRGQE